VTYLTDGHAHIMFGNSVLGELCSQPAVSLLLDGLRCIVLAHMRFAPALAEPSHVKQRVLHLLVSPLRATSALACDGLS